jgi:Fic family protein
MRRNLYIHERPQWPQFTWEEGGITALLAGVSRRQGRLLGKMEALGFELRSEASLQVLTSDVVKSSAIEGEALNPEEVRSSIARRLGLDAAGLPKAGRDVDGIVEMMVDATRAFQEPLTAERLFGWHSALFPTGRSGTHRITVGAWRTRDSGPMQVVSGPMGRETVHFEAPHADRLEAEMQRFIDWFNGPGVIDPLLKTAIAHLWFVTIHPFDDGNGRIARAIADMALARADGSKDRFYSMSSQIALERKEYYQQLEWAQRGTIDITVWLEWFLACLERAVTNADGLLSEVLQKGRFWRRIQHVTINDRQRTIINKMLNGFEGFMTTSKYATLAKCSGDTALRDIQGLVAQGVFVKNPGIGRKTSYRLADSHPRG